MKLTSKSSSPFCLFYLTILYSLREKGQSALHHCVIRGYTDIVNLLTGGCAGWNNADPFQAQCQRLFEHVIDLNVQDYEGDTPLHIASR